MTRQEIIELMAEAIDEHYKHLGIGPCEIAYALANDAMRVLTTAGLAIVPIEPSEAMIEAAHQSNFAGNDDDNSVYRAMIAAAIKEGRE